MPPFRKPLPTTPQASPYAQFCARWTMGCGSDQCTDASRIVLMRGTIPCDILFVGEAPGESEDTIGRPFCGPAGQVLDDVVTRAVEWTMDTPQGLKALLERLNWPEGGSGYELLDRAYEADLRATRCAFTNMVCCIPRDEYDRKATEPADEQIRACAPRLQQFVALASPKLIVTVGSLARDWLDPKAHANYRVQIDAAIPQVSIVHPAAVLRMPLAHRGLAAQKAVVTIKKAIREYL